MTGETVTTPAFPARYFVSRYSTFTERPIARFPLPHLTPDEFAVLHPQPDSLPQPSRFPDHWIIRSDERQKIEVIQRHLPDFRFDFTHCEHFFDVATSQEAEAFLQIPFNAGGTP